MRRLSILLLVAVVSACAEAPARPVPEPPSQPARMEQPVYRLVPTPKNVFAAEIGDRVLFDYDTNTLRPDARATLIKQAGWLALHTGYTVVLEGHTDERSTSEYNLALGDRRANVVRDFLIANGVAAARIRTVSYGKERPVALGANEAAWAQNRRVVTVLQ